MMYSFLNGEFLPADKTFLHVSDLSVQRGYGVFDFFKVVDGRIPFFDDYINRFYYSAAQMFLPVPLSTEELKEVVLSLLERNGMADAGIKLLLTGGYAGDGYSISQPNLVITQHHLPVVPGSLIEEGVKIITHAFCRELPQVKSINYVTGIRLQQKVREAQAYDVLYHLDGVLSEFPRCNIFIVRKTGEVVTPGSNVLEGITRKQVLALDGIISIKTGLVTMQDLLEAREAFLTSTTKRILPIVSVDDNNIIGTGKPGAVTISLLEQLKAREQSGSK